MAKTKETFDADTAAAIWNNRDEPANADVTGLAPEGD